VTAGLVNVSWNSFEEQIMANNPAVHFEIPANQPEALTR